MPKQVRLMLSGLAVWACVSVQVGAADGPNMEQGMLPKPALAADVQEVRARELVRALGSEKYNERQAAQEALKCLGHPALEPLREALDADNAEVRSRAAGLLVDLRGRGFMGVQLQEQYDGQPVHGEGLSASDGNENDGDPQGSDTPKSTKPQVRSLAPDVVAIEVVRGMQPPMPAETAGVQEGDKFVSVNGQPIQGLLDLLREVILAGPGSKAAIVVDRNGKKVTLAVDLTVNPEDRPPIDLTAGVAEKRRKTPVRQEVEE